MSQKRGCGCLAHVKEFLNKTSASFAIVAFHGSTVGTSLFRTAVGQRKVSYLCDIVRCPDFRGCKAHKHGVWASSKKVSCLSRCPDFMGPD